ncbi:MAG: hypothetical protein Q8Q38_01405 [bacterium]|nr:hypothetical protein [bacterium]
MQFELPQFIERESKIVGPLTFIQFVYVGVGVAASLFFYFTLPFFLALVLGILCIGSGSALAFVRVSGRSLPTVVLNLFSFSVGAKTYIWRREMRTLRVVRPTTFVQEKKAPVVTRVKSDGKGRIKNLALRVETR